MSGYTIGSLPVFTLPDGRRFVSAQDVEECGPAAGEFMKRFSHYWTVDSDRGGWVSLTPPTDTKFDKQIDGEIVR